MARLDKEYSLWGDLEGTTECDKGLSEYGAPLVAFITAKRLFSPADSCWVSELCWGLGRPDSEAVTVFCITTSLKVL